MGLVGGRSSVHIVRPAAGVKCLPPHQWLANPRTFLSLNLAAISNVVFEQFALRWWSAVVPTVAH